MEGRCSVCFNIYIRPLLLDCGHSVCETCFRQLPISIRNQPVATAPVSSSSRSRSLPVEGRFCPLCNHCVEFAARNFALEELLAKPKVIEAISESKEEYTEVTKRIAADSETSKPWITRARPFMLGIAGGLLTLSVIVAVLHDKVYEVSHVLPNNSNSQLPLPPQSPSVFSSEGISDAVSSVVKLLPRLFSSSSPSSAPSSYQNNSEKADSAAERAYDLNDPFNN